MDVRQYILYEDGEVLVCHKPPKTAVQTNRTGTQDMVSLLKNYLYGQSKEKKEPYLGVIHRLDQPVEGLLVFAKTPFAAKELSRQIRESGFGKEYQAIVCGVPQEEEGTLTDYMVKDARTNSSRICKPDEPGAKKAVLHYRVQERLADGRTLLHIRLETGRHHQIRVQLANAGCPIWGDTKYNPDAGKENRWEQIALCAFRLAFTHPRTKKKMTFALEAFREER